MRQIALRGGDLEGFRAAARELLAAGLPPSEVLWSVQGAGDPLALPGLLDPAAAERRPATGAAVPRAFLRLAEAAVCHRAPEALGLLYRVVYRLTHGEPRLLEVSAALQLSPWQRAWMIVLPAVVPRLFVALRQGVAIALVVAVTVEIAANPNGMGYAMMIAQQSLDPALMLAWLFWIGVVGFVINASALRLQARVARQMGEVAP